jgi:hypothetical protein
MDVENMSTETASESVQSSGDPAQSSGAAEGGTQSSEAGFSDTATGGEASNQQTSDATGGAESAEGKKSEKNSKYAEMRRAQEQKAANATADPAAERAQALQKERLDTIIAVTGGENPYTHEPIKDWTDAQEYLTMRRIEQGGGDPLQDYAKAIKAETRDREAKEAAAAQKQQWYLQDRAAFSAEHPDINADDLTKDADFSAYAQGKIGKVPLTQIYQGYRAMVDKITAAVTADVEARVTRTVAQSQANRQASPGSLSGSGDGKPFFTREQVQKMTRAEVSANYDQIMESQRYWK